MKAAATLAAGSENILLWLRVSGACDIYQKASNGAALLSGTQNWVLQTPAEEAGISFWGGGRVFSSPKER